MRAVRAAIHRVHWRHKGYRLDRFTLHGESKAEAGEIRTALCIMC